MNKIKRMNNAIKNHITKTYPIPEVSPRGHPWPRGHILKSLALALTLKPQVLGLGLEASSPRK